MADIFVLIDDDVALLGADREGNDLLLELAGLLRGLGLVLRGEREPILLVAAKLPFGRDVLGRLAHVIAIEDIDQAVAQHRVDEFEVAHFDAGAQIGAVLGLRHALLAAGDDDLGVAVGDLLQAERDGAQARAANLIEAAGGLLLRHAGLHRRLASRILALPRRQHLTEDDLVDVGGIDLGALERRLDGGRAKLVRGRCGEGSVERSDSRTRRAHDYNIRTLGILHESSRAGRYVPGRRGKLQYGDPAPRKRITGVSNEKGTKIALGNQFAL